MCMRKHLLLYNRVHYAQYLAKSAKIVNCIKSAKRSISKTVTSFWNCLQSKTKVIHTLKYLKVWSEICKWFGHGRRLNLEGAEFSLCQSARDLLTYNWLPIGVIDIFLITNVRKLKDLSNDT